MTDPLPPVSKAFARKLNAAAKAGEQDAIDKENARALIGDKTVSLDDVVRGGPAREPIKYQAGFPIFTDGTLLSWSLGLYNTWAEEAKDYPRMRLVIRAMLEKHPADLECERRDMVRASFGMFGNSAAKMLRVIEQEMVLWGVSREELEK